MRVKHVVNVPGKLQVLCSLDYNYIYLCYIFLINGVQFAILSDRLICSLSGLLRVNCLTIVGFLILDLWQRYLHVRYLFLNFNKFIRLVIKLTFICRLIKTSDSQGCTLIYLRNLTKLRSVLAWYYPGWEISSYRPLLDNTRKYDFNHYSIWPSYFIIKHDTFSPVNVATFFEPFSLIL